MRLVLLIISLAVSSLALGQQSTVYRTVDENGVVSFSDTPPEEGGADKVQIDAPAPSSTGEYVENLEAMRETTDRMAEDRRAREKHRAEMRELAARTEAYEQSQQPQVIEYDNYLPSYVGGYYRPGHGHGRPPWRPGYRPKPEHPIARPPQRTQNARPTQGNAQLMRPITPR